MYIESLNSYISKSFLLLKIKNFSFNDEKHVKKKIVEIFKKICYNYNRIKEKGEKIKMAGKLLVRLGQFFYFNFHIIMKIIGEEYYDYLLYY